MKPVVIGDASVLEVDIKNLSKRFRFGLASSTGRACVC